MRKVIFLGTGIVLLCLAVWLVWKVSRPHGNVASAHTEFSLTAASLYNEFRNAEQEANKKWVGRVIEISGVISSINETGNYIAIDLRVTDEGGINCSVLNKDLPKNYDFKPGDSIIVKGKCTGFLTDVNMVDCVIKNNH